MTVDLVSDVMLKELPVVRFVCAVALSSTLLLCSARGADEKAILALGKNLKVKDANARLKAAESLGKIGPDAKIVSREICDAVLDPNAKVSAAALAALDQVRPDLHKPLAKALLDKNNETRLEGFQELGRLGAEAKPAGPVVATWLTRTAAEDVAGKKAGMQFSMQKSTIEAYKALAKIEADEPEVTKQLKALAGPAMPHNMHRYFALEYLVSWAGENEGRRKELIPFIKAGLELRGEGDLYIKFAAKYGALGKDFLPALKGMQQGRGDVIRDEAKKAADAIEKAIGKK